MKYILEVRLTEVEDNDRDPVLLCASQKILQPLGSDRSTKDYLRVMAVKAFEEAWKLLKRD